MARDHSKEWNTSNEIRYFNGLIAGKWLDRPPLVFPLQLCKNFIRGAKRRKAWGTYGGVNADKVIKHAQNCMENMEG